MYYLLHWHTDHINCWFYFTIFSGTPLFWTSEMQTSRFNGHFALVRIAFPLKAIHYNQTPRYSVKRTGSQLVPLVPGLYKTHWIMRMLACLPCKFVCYRWLIQHYNSIGIRTVLAWYWSILWMLSLPMLYFSVCSQIACPYKSPSSLRQTEEC